MSPAVAALGIGTLVRMILWFVALDRMRASQEAQRKDP